MFTTQHGQGQCISVENLTDAIVDDMISRVANCKDQVQAVFLGLGSVCLSVCVYVCTLYVSMCVCLCVCMYMSVCVSPY